MPSKSLKPCGKPGCKELTKDRYCKQHQQDTAKQYEQERGSAAQRGYDRRWQKARLVYLAKHPLCVHCQAEGRVKVAEHLDHIVAHKGNAELFWNESNWQGLCHSCHSKKTVREDGGWGR
ncbi:HNH endonuclease [Brevibacillus choshinensis]|uniref:HNH endonuclease n=1 Tax=Brevibacillus choshinensis TaxID=54911 RepID=UPI002E2089AA|nr:HNH endonuclease [Brevibacillus choshinensis]MED4586658.1 HNH endonuclease [Brevibacillus choshinensis]